MTTQTKPAYNVVGTRPVRPDGVEKVTGRAQYGADISLPGMLFGRIKRSPHAHARIVSIDTSKAEALPGVRCVVTHDHLPGATDEIVDLGESVTPYKWTLDNTLASDKALYQGHAVAALCATDPHIAEDALELIEVEYELLPPVLNVHDAMAEGAPLLHESMRTVEMVARFVAGDGRGERFSNIASQLQFELGDAEAAFAEADVIVEGEFETAAAHQGYIEPQNGTAQWNSDGTLTVWVSTQGPFVARATLSKMLDIPLGQVKVVPMEIGGGFGGKLPAYMEPLAALMSRMTGRPVKMYMNREEVLIGTGPTSSTYVRARLGAKADGTLIAADATLGLRGRRLPRLAGRRGRDLHALLLRHSQPLRERARCRDEQAEVPGVSGPRFATGHVRGRMSDGPAGRAAEPRSDGAARAERRPRGQPPRRRRGHAADRRDRDDAGRDRQPALPLRAAGQGRWPRGVNGLLDQRGHGVGQRTRR